MNNQLETEKQKPAETWGNRGPKHAARISSITRRREGEDCDGRRRRRRPTILIFWVSVICEDVLISPLPPLYILRMNGEILFNVDR